MRCFIKISGTVFNIQSGHEYMVEMAMFYDQMAITPKVTRVKVHVFCTSSHSALHLCEVFLTISQSVFYLQSRHEYMVEMALFNVRRAITPKVGKPELPFMCFAHHLVVLYICVKFGDNISDSIEWLKMMKTLTDGHALKISAGIT